MQPVDQPKFGEIYRDGTWSPTTRTAAGPARPGRPAPARLLNKGGNLAQLSDLAEDDPALLDYLADAYLEWIDAGADAFRSTPPPGRGTTSGRPSPIASARATRLLHVRRELQLDAGTIAQHQRPENGGISVLDFPGKDAMRSVFEQPGSDYGKLSGYLHLSDLHLHQPLRARDLLRQP